VGWNSVSVSGASPAMLVIWAVMMYISSYPVALSVRYVSSPPPSPLASRQSCSLNFSVCLIFCQSVGHPTGGGRCTR
jgi:hypothetical protein